MKFAVWYMRPEWFVDGNIAQRKPDPTDLAKTHVFLKDVDIEPCLDPLERLFVEMQGEVWSPNGEAKQLIRGKGLHHTSMSIGDVAVDESGQAHVATSFGFEAL